MKTKAHRRELAKYAACKAVSIAMLALTIVALAVIILFIIARGAPHVNTQLLFGEYGRYPSIKPAFAGTSYLILISVAIAGPIGIGSAIYMTEYTKTKSRLIRSVRVAIETLAGIPSIVYGIFGYLIFVVALGFRYSLVGGGVTLAIMILPVIVRSTEESLLAVPATLREGSFALGASKVRTIFSVVLPCAASGIVSSLILAVGRVMSESAVLILTIGMVVNKMPESLASPGTSLALDVYYFGSHGYPEQAAATGLVLLVFVAVLNAVANALGKKFGKGELANG
ncbi:MAG: phosphate ABC transporter permease PstA [Oscillospiraceae bacterium]|nr:phosphate ABC transporter permease PstA [Oscillospiraceae bacterium]